MVLVANMFSTRSTRLLILALLIAVTFLYIGWDRPLAWGGIPDFATDPAAEGVADGKVTALPSGGDALRPPGSSSPGPGQSPPKITDVYGDGDDDEDEPEVEVEEEAEMGEDDKDYDGYDYERPTNPEDVPPAASINPGKVEEEAPKPAADCPMSFESYMSSQPGPKSTGRRQFPLVRPPPECRTFVVPELEEYIDKMESVIKDPDLYRLFQNSYPNTLDTMVKWHGYAQDNGTDTTEELSYISKYFQRGMISVRGHQGV